MPEQQDFDITAIISQINTLKRQRDNAMDDVAILMGQLESLKISFKELKDAQTAANIPRPVENADTAEETVGT